MVLVGLTMSMTSFANPPANLGKILADVKSMKANFAQTTQGAKTTSFSGSMAMVRPNQFRWNITTPSAQLIVVNGNTLWVYDKDLAQATRQSAGNHIGETPALLLSGNPESIANNFNVSQPNASKNYFVLTPKNANANFKSLSISFNQGRPVMMVLNDNLGQTTSIRFSNVQLNGKIGASEFNFTPPAGVDVIDQ